MNVCSIVVLSVGALRCSRRHTNVSVQLTNIKLILHPYDCSLKAVVYFDLRVKQEQLTQEGLATQMGLIHQYDNMVDPEIVVAPGEGNANDAGAVNKTVELA